MMDLMLIGLAFLTGFLVIFALNLVITDVFLHDREKMKKRVEEESRARRRDLVKQALAGRDLDELAEEALRETSTDTTFWDDLIAMIEQSGVSVTPWQLVGACFATALACGGAVGFLSGSSVIGVMVAMVAGFLPLAYVKLKRDQRADALLSQLPDALELMSRIMRAGQTISQAMFAVGTEFRAPIATEFSYAHEQQALGLNQDVVLRDLAKRTGLLEIRIFVLGLLIHRRSGGNLTELLDNLASIIRERHKLRGKIKAMTAEGRFQAGILLVLPIIAFFGMFIAAHDYAVKILDFPWLLIGCTISMGCGAFWIRRIVNFDF